MSTHDRLVSIAIVVAVLLTASVPTADAGGGSKITGVWLCAVTRPGSTVARPISFVFHSDGTMSYSSQSTIYGPFPFTSRGGGYGEWEKIASTTYAFRARENMYIDGNAGGFFYVESTQHLDPTTGQLCSGTPDCPETETRIRLTRFIFDEFAITDEEDLLPPGSKAVILCSRLQTVAPWTP